MAKFGKLYLIPSPLGENAPLPLPQHDITLVHRIDTFIVERGKTARRFLKQLAGPIALQQMTFFELNRKTPTNEIPNFLAPALQGKDIGIISEAGCPGVADPGAEVVRLAHKKGIEVIPLIGPSSILLALMASGMNGQSFAFHGYLPIKGPERKKALQRLEKQSRQARQTQIFIETPYRNNGIAEDSLKALSPDTAFCIAVDLTLPTQSIQTKKIKDWKKAPLKDLHKRPAIFLLLG